MRRRDFTVLLVAGTAMWPLRVYAQQPRKTPRIGVLLGSMELLVVVVLVAIITVLGVRLATK